jgi:hypothetical protein
MLTPTCDPHNLTLAVEFPHSNLIKARVKKVANVEAIRHLSRARTRGNADHIFVPRCMHSESDLGNFLKNFSEKVDS